MIKILDNIIPKKEQNLIKNTLLDNAEFPWTFVNDVSIKNNKHQTRPGFKHITVVSMWSALYNLSVVWTL